MLRGGENFLSGRGNLRENPNYISHYGYIFFSIFFACYILSLILDLDFLFFILLIGFILTIVSIYAIELALCLIPIVLSNPLGLKPTGTNLILSEYVLLIVFGIYFIQLFISKNKYYFPKQILIPSLIIIIFAVFSLISAKYPYYGFLQVVRYIEILIVLFFVIINVCNDRKCFERMILAILVGGGIASIIGLYQFISETAILGYSVRAYGLLGAGFGAILSTTLMFCIGILLYEKRRIFRFLAVTTIPPALLGLLLNQTRAWIGSFIVVLLFLMVWKNRIKFKKIILLTGIALFALVVLISSNIFGLVEKNIFLSAIKYAFRFGPRPGVYSTEDISLFLRFNVWIFAIGLFIQNPIFGIGAGNLRFLNYLPPQLGSPSPELGYVDNQFIQFFVEIGFIGGIAWIIYLLNAMRIGSRNLTLTVGTNLRAYAFGLYGSMAVFVVGSIFWVITPTHELFAYLIMLVALTVSLNRMQQQSKLL